MKGLGWTPDLINSSEQCACSKSQDFGESDRQERYGVFVWHAVENHKFVGSVTFPGPHIPLAWHSAFRPQSPVLEVSQSAVSLLPLSCPNEPLC